MTTITTKRKIILIIFVMIFLSVLAYFPFSKDTSQNDSLLNQTYFSEDESIVYLGNDSVSNEILFIFDYSCTWCHHWMDEIFPAINKLVENKAVKFRTQSLAILDGASLQLSKIDQHIKSHYPDRYFEIFLQIIADGRDENYVELLENQYIDQLITTYQLDKELISSDPKLDALQLTSQYADKLDIESVPTVIVNGKKVKDPFSFEEIESLIQ